MVWHAQDDLSPHHCPSSCSAYWIETLGKRAAMTKCRDPRIGLPISKLIVAIVILLVIGCGQEGVAQYQTTDSNSAPQISVIRPALSDAARAGEALFNANCSLCHGVNAEGALQGPTLIDSIYKPGHHSDFSIRAAVRQGVRQHHWSFGDMPPVSGVSSDDVEKIICYIREMQQANGIFERDANLSTC